MRYAVGFLCVAAGIALCQAARKPHFEVASVKPWDGNGPAIRGPGVYATVSISDTSVSMRGAPLRQMIQVAYGVQPYQIVGPEWLASSTEKFEVMARIPAEFGKNDVPAMMQALLVERFGLVAHRTTSLQPAYALVIAKGGPKLMPALEGTDEEPVNKVKLTGEGVLGTVRSKSPFGPFSFSMSDGVMHYEYMQMTIAGLAEFLTPLQGLPVVNETDLEGEYDIKLDVSSSDINAKAGLILPDAPSSPPGASFFNAVERLGLKLEQTKAPLEQIIVDSVNKMPTAN